MKENAELREANDILFVKKVILHYFYIAILVKKKTPALKGFPLKQASLPDYTNLAALPYLFSRAHSTSTSYT